MALFADFQLPAAIEKALKDLEFTEPTPIQEKSIPDALNNQDIIACAQTGSGKTLAFTIPMLAKLQKHPHSRAMILAPTRELAHQISDVVKSMTKFMPEMKLALLIGGMDMRKQFRALKFNPQIIIGTPGRVTDHLRQKSLVLNRTEFLVLDEGDRMLDMGFSRQLDEILRYLPEKRQTLLYSATISEKVRDLANDYLVAPTSITVGPASQPVTSIRQRVIQASQENKDDKLLDELNNRQGSIIVFVKTKGRTDRLSRFLEGYGYSVARIHGGRTQGQRNMALKGFRSGTYRILVATDIAARGIDVPQIQHVINYDLPMFDEDYVHRIGRTARAGAEGEAVSFVLPQDRHFWGKLVRKYKIQGGEISSEKSGFKKEKSFSKSDRPFKGKKSFDRSLGSDSHPMKKQAKRERFFSRDDDFSKPNKSFKRKRHFDRSERTFESERSFSKNSESASNEKPFSKNHTDRKFKPNKFKKKFFGKKRNNNRSEHRHSW